MARAGGSSRGQLRGGAEEQAEGGGDVPHVDGGVESAGRRRSRGRQGPLGSGVGPSGVSRDRRPGRSGGGDRWCEQLVRRAIQTPGRLEGIVFGPLPVPTAAAQAS